VRRHAAASELRDAIEHEHHHDDDHDNDDAVSLRVRARHRRRARSARTGALVGILFCGLRVAAQDDTDTRPLLAPRLTTLLDRARVAVVGDVGAVDEHDDGRLLRAHVRAGKVFKGPVDITAVEVLEDRRFPSVPPTLKSGRRVAVFLVPAKSNTQIKRALPPGEYYRLVDDRLGLISLDDAAAESAVIAAFEGWRAVAAARDPVERDRIARRVVFAELGAGAPRVVEDGVAALRDSPGLAGPLAPAEMDIIASVVRRPDLPERVRVILVETIAAADWRGLVPALRDLPAASPTLVRAAALARTQLGAGLDDAERQRVLQNPDPAIRAANVPALLRADKGGVPAIATLALEDPAPEVRLAAVQTLGESGAGEALPTLARTFADSDPQVRLESARSIHRIGGRPAAELLAQLAFTAPVDMQGQAAALLLTLNLDANDPLIVKIRDTHPDPAVRDLLTHGLKGHAH
jgi:hypothetical protein